MGANVSRPGGRRGLAWDAVGGLSGPSQMPCAAHGLSAFLCKVGGLLTKVKDSVCSRCYALRGRSAMPAVQESLQAKFEAWRASRRRWRRNMVSLINDRLDRYQEDRFRWFWSGDLQELQDLEDIARVAWGTPCVDHWLPTKEYGIVLAYIASGRKFPENLNVRISTPRMDQEPRNFPPGTTASTIHWKEEPKGFVCPVDEGERPDCGDCRACWDRSVPLVTYRAKWSE